MAHADTLRHSANRLNGKLDAAYNRTGENTIIAILNSMQITVELPEDIARHPDPGREALEALAIEGYRSQALTHFQASQLLGLSRFEFDGFLKNRNVYDHAYDVQDLEQDLATLRQVDEEHFASRR